MRTDTALTARPPDFDHTGVARYHQLASLFRRRIECGEWPVGGRVPTIEALSGEFRVAPATVRKAVDSLVQEGLLACYRAKGTFVLKGPGQSLWQEIETNSAGFLRARGGARIELLSQQTVEALPPRPNAEGRPAASYLRLRRLYWRDGEPFALIDTYIDTARAGQLSDRDLATQTNKDLLDGLRGVKGVKVSSLRQTLTIGAADPDAARLLRIPMNSPIAKIDRCRVGDDETIVLFSHGVYRGDVVRLDFHEEPG